MRTSNTFDRALPGAAGRRLSIMGPTTTRARVLAEQSHRRGRDGGLAKRRNKANPPRSEEPACFRIHRDARAPPRFCKIPKRTNLEFLNEISKHGAPAGACGCGRTKPPAPPKAIAGPRFATPARRSALRLLRPTSPTAIDASGARARPDHEGVVAVFGDLPPEIFLVAECLHRCQRLLEIRIDG